MRKSVISLCALAALGASLGLPLAPAGADQTPAPSISPTPDAFKVAQEQFRRDRDAFMEAMRERDLKMRVINATFKSAVDKATADAKIALITATTPEQKNAIVANRRSAVASAITVRDAAILALGPLPTPPVPPVKPEKMEQDQRGKQKR